MLTQKPIFTPTKTAAPTIDQINNTIWSSKITKTQSIPNVQSKVVTFEDFRNKAKLAKEQWYQSTEVLQRYRDKGYTIQGINYDDFLEPAQAQQEATKPTTKKPIFDIVKWITNAKKWMEIWWPIASALWLVTWTQTWSDVVGWYLDSATWLPRWAAKIAITWAEKVWVINEDQKNKAKSFIDSTTNIWQNKESPVYQWSKTALDLIQTVAPTWVAWSVWKLVWGGKIWKVVWAAAQWAADTQVSNILDKWELASANDTAYWSIVGWWLEWVWQGIKRIWEKVPSTLQMAWLVNRNDLSAAAKAMHSENDIKNVWKWMLDKWIVWSKENIVTKLSNLADDSHAATKQALSKSSTVHSVPAAEWALTKLKNAFWWDTPEAWLEDIYNQVDWLLKKAKEWWLTLADLNDVQKLQWEYLPNFVKAWSETRDTLSAKANANLYNQVKKYIEDTATNEWLWNIKDMKKTTQLAYMLKQAVWKKIAADEMRQYLSPFAGWAVWWLLWSSSWPWITEDPAQWSKNTAVWAILWALTQNKKIQSQVANQIYKVWKKKSNSIIDVAKRVVSAKASNLNNEWS